MVFNFLKIVFFLFWKTSVQFVLITLRKLAIMFSFQQQFPLKNVWLSFILFLLPHIYHMIINEYSWKIAHWNHPWIIHGSNMLSKQIFINIFFVKKKIIMKSTSFCPFSPTIIHKSKPFITTQRCLSF